MLLVQKVSRYSWLSAVNLQYCSAVIQNFRVFRMPKNLFDWVGLGTWMADSLTWLGSSSWTHFSSCSARDVSIYNARCGKVSERKIAGRKRLVRCGERDDREVMIIILSRKWIAAICTITSWSCLAWFMCLDRNWQVSSISIWMLFYRIW